MRAMRAMRDIGLTAGCLFSGMGGFASGLAQAGFDLSWAVDENPHACATFRHRLPRVRVLEQDVRQLRVDEARLDPVDLLAAGGWRLDHIRRELCTAGVQ